MEAFSLQNILQSEVFMTHFRVLITTENMLNLNVSNMLLSALLLFHWL